MAGGVTPSPSLPSRPAAALVVLSAAVTVKECGQRRPCLAGLQRPAPPLPLHRAGGDSSENYVNSKHWQKWQRQRGGVCSALLGQSSPLLKEMVAKSRGGFVRVLHGEKLITECIHVGEQREALQMRV